MLKGRKNIFHKCCEGCETILKDFNAVSSLSLPSDQFSKNVGRIQLSLEKSSEDADDDAG